MAEKTIAVLGGGIGGLVAARQLRTLLGRKHRIILVDKSLYHTFPYSFVWSLLGWRKSSEIKKPLSMVKRYNIRYQNALINGMHLTQNVIQTNKEIIWYDYLIIALGAEPAYHLVPGLSIATPTFYTLEGAEYLQPHIRNLTSGKIAILIGGMPHRYPPAPYEAALLLDHYYRDRGRKNISIEIYTPESSPLSSDGPGVGATMVELLQRRGIKFFPNHTISNIYGGKNEITFENGEKVTSDIFMVAPPYQPPAIIKELGILTADGWIAVEPRTLRTKIPNVYAVGDITSIAMANGRSLPKAGVIATKQADVVANNLALELESTGKLKMFEGKGHFYLEAGNGTASNIKANFFERPAPKITLSHPKMAHHWRKLLYEKYWFFRWF